MGKALRYIVDEKGHRYSVLISISAWDDLNARYNKLLRKVNILTGVQKGFEEVADARKRGRTFRH